MKCPICNCQDSRVLDSRPANEGASIKRRRECPACGKRFTTYEVIDTVPIAVVKRDGRKEFFDKHKLILGIERACQKRPVDSEEIAASIEAELQNSFTGDITSKALGEMVLARLKEIDTVSYIRFASVYREFKDVDTFLDELNKMIRGSRQPMKRKRNEEHEL